MRAWVEAEACRVCIVDELEVLEHRWKLVQRRLRSAKLPRDPIGGEPIPMRFLTRKGWE